MSEHFNVGIAPPALKQDIIARLIERARNIDSGKTD